MRIGLVTTWGKFCGISTYSEQLSVELLRQGIFVVALAPDQGRTGERPPGSEAPYEIAWTEGGFESAARLSDAVKRLELDLVHIQHEDGLWRASELLKTVAAIRRAGARAVITLHTVLTYGDIWRTGFYDRLRSSASAVIAHTVAGRAALTLARGDARVMHIPHGTPMPTHSGDEAKGWELLGLPPELLGKVRLCLVFGFQGRGKNPKNTIYNFTQGCAQRLIRDTLLVIKGGGANRDPNFAEQIDREKEQAGYENRVFRLDGFVPVPQVADVMAAADFGVLNTDSWNLSASGQTHLYAAHGVPIAVPTKPIYHEAIMAGAVPFEHHHLEMWKPTQSGVDAIASLAKDERLRNRVAFDMERFALQTRWDKIASVHATLYKELM